MLYTFVVRHRQCNQLNYQYLILKLNSIRLTHMTPYTLFTSHGTGIARTTAAEAWL